MQLKIKVEKVMVRGERGYRVVSIEGFTEDQLPKEYRNGPCCFVGSTTGNLFFCGPEEFCDHLHEQGLPWLAYGVVLERGARIPVDKFNNILNVVRSLGNTLHRINKKLRNDWRGEEVFTI